MSEIELWYLRASRKYVWDADTIKDYVEVFSEIVCDLIKDYDYIPHPTNNLLSQEIGILRISDERNPVLTPFVYALYFSDVKIPDSKSRTLFADFKIKYKIVVGADEVFPFGITEDYIRKQFPDRAEALIERKRERDKLVRDFRSIANRSLNHRRSINKRVRYMVLRRDNSTCQICGRKAPEVRVHIDHIRPVSWGNIWSVSDNHDDYQVLCEDCNVGKGDLSWLID